MRDVATRIPVILDNKNINFWDNFDKKEKEKGLVYKQLTKLDSQEQSFLFRRYGTTLDKLISVPDSIIRQAQRVVRKIQIGLKSSKKINVFVGEGICLNDILGCGKKEQNMLVESIHEDINSFRLLKKVFGIDFMNEADTSDLSVFEINKLQMIIDYFKDLVDSGLEVVEENEFGGKTVYEALGCSLDYFKTYVSKIVDKNSLIYLVLIKIYGVNFGKKCTTLSAVDKKILDSFANDFIRKMMISSDYDGKTLPEILNCDETLLELKILGLNANDPVYSTFLRLFGSKFDKKFYMCNLSNQDRLVFFRFVTNFNAQDFGNIRKFYESKTLAEFLKCTQVDLNNIISKMYKYSKSYLVLMRVYGPDFTNIADLSSLTNKDISFFENLLLEMFKKVNRVETPLKSPFFKEVINLLPIEYQKATSLRLGLEDGKLYSIKDIAAFLNIDEVNASTLINNGICYFVEIVKHSQKQLEVDEMQAVLTLVK